MCECATESLFLFCKHGPVFKKGTRLDSEIYLNEIIPQIFAYTSAMRGGLSYKGRAKPQKYPKSIEIISFSTFLAAQCNLFENKHKILISSCVLSSF